jgi:hypothetical protein
MVQRSQQLRFAVKASQPFGIVRQRLRQYLDGDVTSKPSIAGAIDLPHATRVEPRYDLVPTDAGAGR